MRQCIFLCLTKSLRSRRDITTDQMPSEVQLIVIENPAHPLMTAHRRLRIWAACCCMPERTSRDQVRLMRQLASPIETANTLSCIGP